MQLGHAHIRNFKGLEAGSFSFLSADSEDPRLITLILGDNGSGKTTLLQAIALVIGLATRRLSEPGDLKWPGLLPERLGSLGTTRVELGVVFSAGELARTQELYVLWSRRARPELVSTIPAPDNLSRVTLLYEDGVLSCKEGRPALTQFLGRYFIKYLLRTEPALRRAFRDVGDVFWFDQNRNLASLENLRPYLVDWWSYHISPPYEGVRDLLEQLQSQLDRVFPGLKFYGTRPRSPESDPFSYVLLERRGRQYDIAEMSSGEQAVFPILYEFVRQEIAHSIVLIDELELHLHPPEQQAILGALRRLGSGCQFIVTSHSPYLEAVIPPEEELRLEGGLRCL